MKPAPPHWMEVLVGLFIPPVCREPVLGDLYERYTGRWRYLLDAVGVAPRVTLSQVRRTTDPRILLLESFAVYLSMLAAAWWLGRAAFLFNQTGFLRLAVLSAMALAAVRLGDAWAPSDRRSPRPTVLGVAVALLLYAALSMAYPRIAVPGRVLIVGGGLSLLLLSAVRGALAPRESVSRVAALRGDAVTAGGDLSQRARLLENQIRRSNLSMGMGAVLIAVLGGKAAAASSLGERIGGGVVLAAAAYVMAQLWRRRPAGTAPPQETSPESYRAQLERRRDDLRNIWSWYLGPILTALLVYALQFPLADPSHPERWLNISPFLILAVAWSAAFAVLIHRAARKLQEELDALQQEREGA